MRIYKKPRKFLTNLQGKFNNMKIKAKPINALKFECKYTKNKLNRS